MSKAQKMSLEQTFWTTMWNYISMTRVQVPILHTIWYSSLFIIFSLSSLICCHAFMTSWGFTFLFLLLWYKSTTAWIHWCAAVVTTPAPNKPAPPATSKGLADAKSTTWPKTPTFPTDCYQKSFLVVVIFSDCSPRFFDNFAICCFLYDVSHHDTHTLQNKNRTRQCASSITRFVLCSFLNFPF